MARGVQVRPQHPSHTRAPMSNESPTAELTQSPLRAAEPPDFHAALRRDIRSLASQLGQTLVRQEGPELLELIERVRHLIRDDRDAAAGLLAALEPGTAVPLARAFTTYFYLANEIGRASCRERV